MLGKFKYKDCEVQVIERKKAYQIRLSNRFGFRWFETTDKHSGYLKVRSAYRIEQDLINNGFKSKYCFVHPIIL